MDINNRIILLREEMKKQSIDYYVINTADPHQSEYVADRFKARVWISGFTGSAGTVIISKDESFIWVDGRYHVQVEKEVEGSELQIFKLGLEGVPNYIEFLKEKVEDGDKIGFDGLTYSQADFERLEASLGSNVNFSSQYDLIDNIWKDRPAMPFSKAFIHEIRYTGQSAMEKIQTVRKMMSDKNIDVTIISSLDDINWLYNIRGRDVKNNPVVFSYAIVEKNSAKIFIDKNKLDSKVSKHFEDNKIEVKSYDSIFEEISRIENKRIYLDKSKTNRLVFSMINKSNEVLNGIDFTSEIKACKNPTEIQNQKIAYIKDGVAISKFLCWLDENIPSGNVSELDAENKLFEFRSQQDGFVENSFDPISAYGPNAAMMHYKASEESNYIIDNKSFYLIDSGGQYYEGTTDITRTIAAGPLTEEEILDFTLTLKGHINLSRAKFLYGTTGSGLDILARIPLWMEGIDYKSGTGHGVGFMLNVHEGPQRISQVNSSVALEEGMITSNEPGVYKAGKHGIRIENIILTVKDEKNESGQFMRFENLSFVPIDLRAINKSVLSKEEIEWLNNYHKETYKLLSPYMEDKELTWLKEATREI